MQSVLMYLSRGGNARPKTGPIQCRDLPGDLAMTICIY